MFLQHTCVSHGKQRVIVMWSIDADRLSLLIELMCAVRANESIDVSVHWSGCWFVCRPTSSLGHQLICVFIFLQQRINASLHNHTLCVTVSCWITDTPLLRVFRIERHWLAARADSVSFAGPFSWKPKPGWRRSGPWRRREQWWNVVEIYRNNCKCARKSQLPSLRLETLQRAWWALMNHTKINKHETETRATNWRNILSHFLVQSKMHTTKVTGLRRLPRWTSLLRKILMVATASTPTTTCTRTSWRSKMKIWWGCRGRHDQVSHGH